jgi:GT2 family glycosyltransferase
MVDGHPKVGVVLLNYRGVEDTLKCLESLHQLTGAPFSNGLQIVVVDNASGDDSIKKLRTYAAHPMIAMMQSDPKVGEVGSVLYEMETPDQVQAWGGGHASVYTGHASHAMSPGGINYITGASALLRVKALQEVGLLDGRFFFQWEDVDLGFRLAKAGWKIAVAGESRVWHKGGASAAAYTTFRMEQHGSGLVLFLRKHSPVPVLAATPILAYYAWLSFRRMTPGIFSAGSRGWMRGWGL